MKSKIPLVFAGVVFACVILLDVIIFKQNQQLKSYENNMHASSDIQKKLEQEYQSVKDKGEKLRQITVLSANVKSPNTKIAKILEDYASQIDGDISIYYKNLNTQEYIVVEGDKTYYMASLYKVILTLYILDQVRDGNLDIKSSVNETGTTVEQALNKIITESNNEYAQMLSEKYGWEKIEKAMKNKLGIQFTFNENMEISINNIGLLFEDIALSLKMSSAQSEYILDLLRGQKKVHKLPKFLPTHIYSHNKTGEYEQYSHDAGIFYTPKANYILIFMSKTKAPGITDEKMAEMSKKIFDTLNQ